MKRHIRSLYQMPRGFFLRHPRAVESFPIPFPSRYNTYNGVNHDEDPVEKGYITTDNRHPSALGAQVTAELLAQMGYEPVPAP
jgi:hypothetical protein